jgi:hypothetical protein
MREIDVLKRFRRVKVLTIEELVDLLKTSVITARRRLKKWEALTSFNQNGRYYTLPKIPQFDHHGIWKYQRILFSKYGNLKQTILELVRRSEAGLSAREVAQIVEIPSNSSLFSQLQRVSGVKREKHQGHFVYFSDEPETYQKQTSVLSRPQAATALPSDEEAVRILVQYIKHPHIGMEELSARVARQGKRMDPSVIQRFLEHQDLLKKIPDTGPSAR